MATAVKTTLETVTRSPHQQLVLSSLLGMLYVFCSFGLVFAGLPMLWQYLDTVLRWNEFLADSLLILATLPIIAGLFVLGKRLEGPHPVHGSRAGAWVGAITLFMILLISLGVGNNWFIGDLRSPRMTPFAATLFTAVVGGGLLFLFAWILFKPGFGRWLVRVEEAGWFHATQFKPNQGLRVRRGTVVGLLLVGICGIITMLQHHALSSGNWQVDVPGTGLMVPIMFKVNMTVPIVLMIGLVWVAWRIVNWPAFADFLIATEAEVNKVSWTTRKRLVQDTVVVLVTVFLFTVFLFVVDIFWIKALRLVEVLNIDTMEERQKQREGSQW